MAHVHAVLIGINVYQQNASQGGWSDLHCPEADTILMKSALERCGWKSSELQVQQYIGSRATHDVIKPVLESALSDRAPEDELVVVFFAGHAKRTAAGALTLALYNTDPLTLKNGLPATEFRKWLDKSSAREAVVILDCCYSGAFDNTGTTAADALSRVWENPARQRLASGCSRAVLTSSWHDQPSSERSFGADGHGLYTEFVARGLTRADPLSLNASGEVDADSLHRYVLLKIEEEGIGQSPLRLTWGGRSPVLKRSESARSRVEDIHVREPRSNAARKMIARQMWGQAGYANALIAGDLAPTGNPVVIAVSSGAEGQILLLSSRDGSGVVPLRKIGGDDVHQLIISPDSKYIGLLTSAPGSADRILNLLPLSARDSEMTLKLRELGSASRIRFSLDGHLLAICGANGQAEVYSIQAGQSVGHLMVAGAGRVKDIAFSPVKKGEAVVALDGQHRLIVWNFAPELETRGGRARKAATQEEFHVPDDPWFIELLDEKAIACATREGRLHLLGVPDGSALVDPLSFGRAPTAFASSSQRNVVACGTTNGEVFAVLREHWEALASRKFSARISDLAFSPDQNSQILAAATAAGEVHLWNYVTGEIVNMQRPSVVGETFVRFSADGSRLLILHEGGKTLELWELVWEDPAGT